MAITHKRNDESEKLMSGFASIPNFDKPLNTDAEETISKEADKKDAKND
ncbi:SPJ_0845 family protein [Streptococcus uberis]|nr:SPJ_0845 family protein [Streptococcus uberis]